MDEEVIFIALNLLADNIVTNHMLCTAVQNQDYIMEGV